MKKIKFILVLTVMSLFFVTSTSYARKNNYIANGHLYVWYNGGYMDMGPYHP